jgi:hypothetical protein
MLNSNLKSDIQKNVEKKRSKTKKGQTEFDRVPTLLESAEILKINRLLRDTSKGSRRNPNKNPGNPNKKKKKEIREIQIKKSFYLDCRPKSLKNREIQIKIMKSGKSK